MIRKLSLFVLFLVFLALPCHSQYLGTSYDIPHQFGTAMPRYTLKNNLLYDATLSLNLAAEVRLSTHYSVELGVSYNPWSFSDTQKFKHLWIQPEARIWLCETFIGHFFGFHPTYAFFNVSGLRLGSLKDRRYEGSLWGAGFSYGYQWYVSERWNIEATIGFGYLYLDYDRFYYGDCGDFEKRGHRHYIGPTRAGVSFIYVLK